MRSSCQEGLRDLHEEVPKGGLVRMCQEGLGQGGQKGVHGMRKMRKAQVALCPSSGTYFSPKYLPWISNFYAFCLDTIRTVRNVLLWSRRIVRSA